MTKEEFIAKYGEEAWARKGEQSRKWKKSHRDSENAAKIKRHNERFRTDLAYRKHNQEKAEKSRLKFKTEMGDAGCFAATQIKTLSRDHIEDLDKYIMENLTREAELDGDPRLINEDFLYDCFIENCQYGLFFGNLQVIKYFVPLMCIKVHRGIELSAKNIEMIKVFDEYRNTSHKKPIEYSFKMYYIRPDQKTDIDMNIKCMLLYNLSADFMHKRSRYLTEKKLY